MLKKALDWKTIDVETSTWRMVENWAEENLLRLRNTREDPNADIRQMDNALGAINCLKRLLDLPELVNKTLKRKPPEEVHFGIAPLNPIAEKNEE